MRDEILKVIEKDWERLPLVSIRPGDTVIFVRQDSDHLTVSSPLTVADNGTEQYGGMFIEDGEGQRYFGALQQTWYRQKQTLPTTPGSAVLTDGRVYTLGKECGELKWSFWDGRGWDDSYPDDIPDGWTLLFDAGKADA